MPETPSTSDHTAELYEQAGILPIRKLFMQYQLTEFLIRNPNRSREVIKTLRPNHDHQTRDSRVKLPITRLVRRDRAYQNRFLKIYRECSEDVDAIIEAEVCAHHEQ